MMKMPQNWKTYKLGDILTIRGGFSYKGEFIGSGEALLLGMGCVSYSDKFVFTGARPYSGDCRDVFLQEPGDIVLATRQQSDNLPILGMPAIIPKELNGKKIIVGTNLFLVKNESEIDNRFLFWLLKSDQYKNHIKSQASGTTVRMITKGDVESFEFSCPPKEQRDVISEILWNFDDKIELNLQMNKTLEEMAMALYKHWFVDFGPFKDGKFVESELGMIPEGWEVKKLGEVSEIISKGTTPRLNTDKVSDNNISFIKVKDIESNGEIKFSSLEKIPEKIHIKELKRSILYTNDILLSIAGTIGRISHVPEDLNNSNCNQAVAFVRLNDRSLLNPLVLYWLKSENIQGSLNNSIVQGVQANVSLTVVRELKIVIPNSSSIQTFNSLIKPLIEQKESNIKENRILIHQRDSLLPKLISGEIKINTKEYETTK